LIPSSSVFAAADLSADRRMYLPMLAFAPAIALMMPRRARWPWIAVGVLAVLSIGRAYVWSSDERLWGEAVQLAPKKIRPRIQLSRAVAPEAALGVLQEAAKLAPQDPGVPTELARVYLELHRNGEALAQAGRALALAPGEPHALNNRGAVLLAMNQTAAARRDFLEALRRDACLGEARENLGRSGGIPAEAPVCAASKD
jgi:tetratricopeptide (TPR) repeat protein